MCREGDEVTDDRILFTDSRQKGYTAGEILERLKQIGADNCEILFIHTDILFGKIGPSLGRKEYLEELYQTLLALNVPTLMFPAFTYSFANHEVFNVRESRTSMGALIEYIRKQPGVQRSMDPLLSMIAVGEKAGLTGGRPVDHCFGPDSGFDRLHQADGVKFLFFGADFSEYFTYIHYIEKMMDVPYRFDMSFEGTIIDQQGISFQHTHSIHTQCGGVRLKNFSRLKCELSRTGHLKTAELGDSELACISEKDIFQQVTERLDKDPYYFVEPYHKEDLTHVYTFGKNGERVTHC